MSKNLPVPTESNKIERNAVDVIRDFFNVGKVKRLFRMGTEVFNAAQPFIEKQTPLNAAKAAFLIGKVIVDDMEVWPDDYFGGDDWDVPYPSDFNKLILGALANKPYKIIRTSDEAVVIYMVHVEDVRFGYVINTKNNRIDRVYVETDKLEKAKQLIKVELWRMMKNDNIVLRHTPKRVTDYDNPSSISLDKDDAFHPMPSKRASEYAAYLKKCIDAGVSRSVMLYGPPGTGKSTMARTIVDSLGMKSFRIRVEDIGDMDSSVVFEAINIFEPDAVILDDFDRSGAQASLLETLEFFQRHVKLVIATVNNRNNLDEAILRPGRFDELLQIKQMDEDVVKSVLGEEHASALETVKEWPIAFIQEYVKRRQFMTSEEAEASTKELATRVQRLKKYEDTDDVNIDGILRKPKRKKIKNTFSDILGEAMEKRKKTRRSNS